MVLCFQFQHANQTFDNAFLYCTKFPYFICEGGIGNARRRSDLQEKGSDVKKKRRLEDSKKKKMKGMTLLSQTSKRVWFIQSLSFCLFYYYYYHVTICLQGKAMTFHQKGHYSLPWKFIGHDSFLEATGILLNFQLQNPSFSWNKNQGHSLRHQLLQKLFNKYMKLGEWQSIPATIQILRLTTSHSSHLRRLDPPNGSMKPSSANSKLKPARLILRQILHDFEWN